MTDPILGVDRAPPGRGEHLLAGLTPEQAQAVQHGPGPLLLLAGPGAGKTKTLTHRVAYLLATGRAQPREILAVTFSVRAADELRLRLADLLDEHVARAVTAATFHSVCARLLREHAGVFGRSQRYTIYDQVDVRRVVEGLLADRSRVVIQQALSDCGQPPSAEILAQVSGAKNRLLSPGQYAENSGHPAARLVAAVWQESALELQRCDAFSFEDLLYHGVQLLSEQPQRLAFLRRRWPWALIDEYQDTNPAQAALVALLTAPAGNVTVVGDDDQAIYAFRSADPRNILCFGETYPGHARLVLGRNFRCRAEILDAAVSCVSHNRWRSGKALIAMRGVGGHVEVLAFRDDHEEAGLLARHISDVLAAGVPGTEILVLARTAYATQLLQRALEQAGIAHRVLGHLGLYERSEVRDALAYLALVANPLDAQAFARAVQSPRRGVGPASVARVVAAARARDRDLIDACARMHDIPGIRRPAHDRLRTFGTALNEVRRELAAGRSVGHAVLSVVMLDGGLVRHFQARRDRCSDPDERRDAERVLEDLRSLCRAAQSFEEREPAAATLTGFLERAAGLHAQELEGEQEDRRLTVSTIHRAKGAEAQVVIVVGCEEGLLPSWRSLGLADEERLAEERRLFYVAATRAKDQLLLSHAAVRGGRPTNGPSRFLTEAGLLAQRQARAA